VTSANVIQFPAPGGRDDAPRVHWNTFADALRRSWGQGQHIAIIGPTDSGKTTLAFNVLPLHPYVVIFATKPKDETLTHLIAKNPKKPKAGEYIRLSKWERLSETKYPRRILWPDARDLDSQGKQREAFGEAFSIIYRAGGWTLYLDELWFMTADLGFDHQVRVFLQQWRSNHGTLVLSSQRPSRIPVEVYDQSRHLFFSRDNDERNLSRISGIAYRSAALIRDLVANLDPHEFLYVNTRTGYMCRITCPPLKEG
jgi:hypothetical protein